MSVTLTLEPQTEKIAPQNPYNIKPNLLYHQWRTVQALQTAPLVMNTYNTGTGKTRASLLHLFHLPTDRQSHVLFIAPTNELIHQHVNDIQEFVTEDNLPFRVIEVNAQLLRQLADPSIVDRQGERLTRLLRNPLEFHQQLGLDGDDWQRQNLILVTNPDLFYYAFYWQFAAADQRNLFQDFVTRFCYIVIDEFHYYNSKQLGNFLLFMILSRQFGYFRPNLEGGYERQVCLLSATPDETTRHYLDTVFGEDVWQLISPDNEPSETSSFEEIPVLAPLRLTLEAGTVNEFATSDMMLIRQLLDDGKDGALISGALWRVNQAYFTLSKQISAERMGRITGAQSVEERRKDQYKPLILATPTVDIGYNFLKKNKSRQNLDFVIFDALFLDQFIQRLGRAGRVLGKDETNIISKATALVSQEIVAACADLDGRTLTRKELVTFLKERSAIPIKDDFRAYLRAGGMMENVYPIIRAREVFARDAEKILAEAFDAIKQVFAPQSNWTYRGLVGYWSKYRKLEQWLKNQEDSKKGDKATLLSEFLGWSTAQTVNASDIEDSLPVLLGQEALTNGFRHWCEMHYALIRSHFNFRDSFTGPVAWIFDPAQLLSSSLCAQYDLIHIVENYEYEQIDEAVLNEKTCQKPPKGAICIYLRSHRQQRQRVELRWQPPKIMHDHWTTSSFTRCFAAGEAIAINGLILKADKPLPESLQTSLAEKYVPMLLVPQKLVGPLLRVTQPRGVYTRDMYVQLEDNEVKFTAVLGTNALLIAPLIRYAFSLRQQKEETAIIC